MVTSAQDQLLRVNKKKVSEKELDRHDMLNSIHSLKLGLSQLEKLEKKESLVSLLLEEVDSLESIILKKEQKALPYRPSDFFNFIERYVKNAYPGNEWQDKFNFLFPNEDDDRFYLSVIGLKVILRNILLNIRESGAHTVIVSGTLDQKWLTILIKSRSIPKIVTNATDGLGNESCKFIMKKNNGRVVFLSGRENFVIKLSFPLLSLSASR